MYSSERYPLLAAGRSQVAGARERVLAVAVGAGASLPVVVATVRALRAQWMPLGDQGIIATRAFDVFTTHAPLLGQYSEASTVTGQPTYSPGPLLYWLLALPARLGAPASLTLTIAALNVACIMGAVALARRRGGVVLMVLAAVAIALMCVSLSAESLHGIFNPSAALFPFLLLVFLCWSLACGDVGLLPLTALVASFVVQCHLGYVAPAGGMLVVAIVGLALARRRERAGSLRPRSLRRPLLLALGVAVICWSLPVAEEVTHHPGNMTVLAREVGTHQRTQGATKGWRVLVRTVGVPPRWLRTPSANAGRLSDMSGGDYGDTRLHDLTTAPGVVERVSAVLILAALALVGVVGIRRRRPDLAAAAALALVLCATLAWEVAVTPLEATNTLGYFLWWDSVAGMWVWLAVGWSAVALLAGARRFRVRAPAIAAGAAVGVVAAAGVAAAAVQQPDKHAPYYPATRALADGLDRAIPAGTSVRLVQRGGPMVAIEPTIRFTLLRHGVRALGPYASRRPGAWYELDHRRYRYVASVNSDRPPHFTPWRVVARAQMTDARGLHRLTATLSPASAHEDLSPRKNAQTARAADIPGWPNPPGHS
jgi:hypothetical protein